MTPLDSRWCFALSLALLACTPLAARADALGPPVACPKGARSQVDHAGARCVPTTCTSAADCSAGHTCESAPLCVRQETHRVYRSFPPREGDPGEDRTRTIAVAPCPDGACSGGLACEPATRCVPRGPAPAAEVEAEDEAPAEGAATPAPTSPLVAESPSASSAPRPVAARPSGACAIGAPASRRASLATWFLLACVVGYSARRRFQRSLGPERSWALRR